jgi:hypothetical protein
MMTSVQDAREGKTVFQAQDRRAIDAGARPITQGFSAQLPLKSLSPGRYLLRVGAQSSVGGYSTERIVPFEVR